jgi:hypothetical protein
MPHTPEQRDKQPLCGAKKKKKKKKKKNGEKCRAFAGQGTAHFGYGRCRFHLGNTQTHGRGWVGILQVSRSRPIQERGAGCGRARGAGDGWAVSRWMSPSRLRGPGR